MADVPRDHITLDEAWTAVKAVLPDGWVGPWLSPDFGREGDEVSAMAASLRKYHTDTNEFEDEFVRGHGATPVEALVDLVANLKVYRAAPAVNPCGVPADLVEWFRGEKVAARRHGLPRFQPRWRVMSVVGLLGETETFGEVFVAGLDLREFKTALGAHEYAKSLEAKGQTVLTQTGLTIWLDADELPTKDADHG